MPDPRPDPRRHSELVLHIGTHKTGTTALQVALAADRRRLAAQGIVYPRLAGAAARPATTRCSPPGSTCRRGFAAGGRRRPSGGRWPRRMPAATAGWC